MSKRLLIAFGSVLTFASHISAQTLPNGCGDPQIQFKVKAVKGQTPPATATGHAQLIIVQSLGGVSSGQPISRVGLDGVWSGAIRGASYTVVDVMPGVHQLCLSRQSGIAAERDNVGSSTFTAEAGKTYIYEFRITRTEVGYAAMKGGAMLPGQLPGSMTAKDSPTVDTAALASLTEEQGRLLLQKLPISNFSLR